MTVTKKDIFKHYGLSVLIYGIILLFIAVCPIFSEMIDSEGFNYIEFFGIYYILYIILAPIILLKTKPESILNSRSINIFNYIKRQFARKISAEERIANLAPNENERNSIIILFMQTYFGVYCVNLLCTKFLPSLQYDYEFLKEMFSQAVQYANASGLISGILQYLDDTDDMWLTIMLGIITLILTISYLSDLTLFKNKIKTIDTTPMGILSCIMCYYPLKILSDKIIPNSNTDFVSVENLALRLTLSSLMIIAEFVILLSVLRLGTKAGNLTNRGIITKFPYNIVRHPQYTMQIAIITITTIPLFLDSGFFGFEKILFGISIIGWTIVYYIRALTEERNLLQDPEYQVYIQKTKYRFIPWLF